MPEEPNPPNDNGGAATRNSPEVGAGNGGTNVEGSGSRAGSNSTGHRETQNWILRTLATLWANIAVIIVGLLVGGFLLIMYWAITHSDGSGNDFLSRLREQEYARGLITFIISVSAIILAFVLVISSLFGPSNTNEEQYRRGREVYTGLMGVLGTIVGFYFGAAQQTTRPLQVAPLQFESSGGTSRVLTFASGGTPPYRYSIQFGKDNDLAIKDKVSETGWIKEDVPGKASNPVEVQVTDRENRQVAARRDRDIPPK
jgi:hypothetical protein